MGPPKSSSQTSTDKSTKVTTTTTTNIRDIGITGQNATELAAVLEHGIVNQTQAIGDIINPLLAGLGNKFTQLVDAAGTAQLSPEAQVAKLTKNNPPSSKIAKAAPLLVLGAGAIYVISKMGK